MAKKKPVNLWLPGSASRRPPPMLVRQKPEDCVRGVRLTDGRDHFMVMLRTRMPGRGDKVLVRNEITQAEGEFSMDDVNATGSIGELYYAGRWLPEGALS